MGSFEKKIFEANIQKFHECDPEINKEQLIKKIITMKCDAVNNPDAINIHLKDIDNKILFDSLKEEDYRAFKSAFDNEWTEDSKEFKQYMEDVLYWKKKGMMDSGVSPAVRARRDFAAMIRGRVIDASADIKLKMKKSIIKIAKNADYSNN